MKMNNMKNLVFDYIKLLLITILVIAIYDGISYKLTHQLYTKGTKSVFNIELIIIFIIVTIFYFPRLKNKILKYFFPIIPILGLYISFDFFYVFLLRSPEMSDIDNFKMIYDFSPLMFIGIIFFILLIVSSIFFMLIKVKQYYSFKEFILTLSVRCLILFSLILFFSTDLFINYQKKLYDYVFWSQQQTIKNNGKISSFLFFTNLEHLNKKKIKLVNNINIQNVLYRENIVNKPNIYYIVLESFVNPNYFKNVKFSMDPLAKELKKYLDKGEFSKIKSPVYGGNTAQAEFEVLTGVNALAKVNTIEFNVLSGKPINAFLNQLKKYNYFTMATIATSSGYFNSNAAYKSLGFEKVVFLEEDKSFKKNKDDKRIFDGDLYKYNLSLIKNYLHYSNKPLFSYVLGMYGHFPYERNIKARPDKIKVNGIGADQNIKRIANQFYYRTKALAKYIKELLNMDHNCIIFVSSDHIPPVLNKTVKYKYDKNINIALMLYNAKPININNKNQYQIPWIIWDILSGKKIERNITKNTMEKLYYKVLNEGI